jgi:hypothetical protein
MERRLRDWLEFEIGAGITVEWLDREYEPVRYNDHETTGLQCEEEEKEPESEASGSESDGNPAIRGWTEAHEPECGYRDEDGHYSDKEDWRLYSV